MKEGRISTEYLDVLRWLAISFVVMLHVVSGVADTVPENMTQLQQAGYETVKNTMTAGVPVFLMISGALFLRPEKEITVEKILKRYVPRILLALFLFGTVFAVLELAMDEKTFYPAMLGQGFLRTLSGDTWAHMWYLYELTGLYLLTPLLKKIIDHSDRKLLEYALALGVVFGSILPGLRMDFGVFVGITLPISGIYLFYYILGYYLHRYGEADGKKCLIGFLLVELLVVLNGVTGHTISINYDTPLIVLASALLFLAARNGQIRNRRASGHRSLCFGIYLVHTVFLNFFYKFLHITPLEIGVWSIPLFWLGTMVFSVLASVVMQKIPF